MEQERTNRNCPLWGTETCARMNMRACGGCPAENKDARECDDIREDVDTLYSLLPEEGIASLFTDESCTLCKGEQKGRRESYGLFDMGHADPRERKKGVLWLECAIMNARTPAQAKALRRALPASRACSKVTPLIQ